MKLDDDAKLVALFWCNSLIKEDFRIYGDVVILIQHIVQTIQLDTCTTSWNK